MSFQIPVLQGKLYMICLTFTTPKTSVPVLIPSMYWAFIFIVQKIKIIIKRISRINTMNSPCSYIPPPHLILTRIGWQDWSENSNLEEVFLVDEVKYKAIKSTKFSVQNGWRSSSTIHNIYKKKRLLAWITLSIKFDNLWNGKLVTPPLNKNRTNYKFASVRRCCMCDTSDGKIPSLEVLRYSTF